MPQGTDWRYLRNSFSVYVTQTTPNPELAWEFALFLINPENQRFMLENVGWLPSRSDVDYTDIVAEQPGFEAFLVSDPAYEPYYLPKLGIFDEIWTKMAERLANAYLDESLVNNPEGIQQVLDDAAEETNSILQREGLYGE
jgi:multiple sugar transport system substrate-binding protein